MTLCQRRIIINIEMSQVMVIRKKNKLECHENVSMKINKEF